MTVFQVSGQAKKLKGKSNNGIPIPIGPIRNKKGKQIRRWKIIITYSSVGTEIYMLQT